MPNRIIKESISSSDKIASLSDFEFRLWVGLITQADDAGRGDARPAIIRGRIFPLRDRVTLKDIDAGLHGLAAKSCVSLYTVGGKPYFWFPTWQKHQRVRECKPKYPSPEEADILPQSAASCGELPQSAALIQSNTIQSESNPNTNTNTNTNPTRDARDDFDVFWDAYPRKVGKKDAKKAFSKVKTDLKTLLTAIETQKKSDQWQKGYIPNPATWLNQGRWEDELPSTDPKRNEYQYDYGDMEGSL